MLKYIRYNNLHFYILDTDDNSIDEVLPCVIFNALDSDIIIIQGLPDLSFLSESYLGNTRKMKNGHYATCIGYRNSNDCDFEFDNSIKRLNVRWRAFISNKLGLKSNDELKSDANIVGLRRQMKSGEFATCIAYRTNVDIDIRFDDGTIRRHLTKTSFMNGDFTNPNKESRLSMNGEEVKMNCGQKAICIEDRGCFDIDIQFEDGTVVTTTRGAFRIGSVANPSLGRGAAVRSKNNFVGLEKVMNCGYKCKIIKYINAKDITVEFEDGIIVEHRYKSDFDRGNILHPNLDRGFTVRSKNSILGQSKVMNDNCKCKVIDYINCDNITVEFEDGTILKHGTKKSFELGQIHNPNALSVRTLSTSLVGVVKQMNNGMFAECIEDFGERNITIEFDDGTLVYNRSRSHFLHGEISNPNFKGVISFPQCIVFYYIKKYFPDALFNYRPDWMRIVGSSRNSELDIYIPSIKVSIEYDGAVYAHLNYNQHAYDKAELIDKSNNIIRHITILEKNCIAYKQRVPKFIYYNLNYISKGYTKEFIIALKYAIIDILRGLNVSSINVSLSREDLNTIFKRRLEFYEFCKKS